MEEKKYYAIVTDVGAAALANAPLAGEKVNIKELAVGDGAGAYYRPTTDMLRLKGEKWRGVIASYEKDAISPNIIVVKTIVPFSVGGFTIREMGLYDDKGRLITIENLPEMEKVKSESGASFDLEITSRILVSNSEALDVVFDPTTVIATKRDIEEHNISQSSHGSRFAGLEEHANNTGIHVNSGTMENFNLAIAELGEHINNGEKHVTADEKDEWNSGALRASEALRVANSADGKVNSQEVRIKRLEDGMFSNLNKNPFLVGFDSLNSLLIVKGCWNKLKQRIEC